MNTPVITGAKNKAATLQDSSFSKITKRLDAIEARLDAIEKSKSKKEIA